MTEADWLACDNLYRLIEVLRTRYRANRTSGGRRKLRLVGGACCRYAWPLFEAEPKCMELIREVERLVDLNDYGRSLVHLAEQLTVPQSVGAGFHSFAVHAALMLTDSNVHIASLAVAQTIEQGVRHVGSDSGVAELSGERQARILRDIFGNPFRPVAFTLEWRTDTVTALAAQMYESRDFSAMPILADALQDAGCDNDDVLAHCRGEGPHARGCWVVDLVLGKK